jgi:hypothetical protein
VGTPSSPIHEASEKTARRSGCRYGLPELDALPEEEPAASLSGELPLVELLPHALAIAARHARHPVSAEWRRTLLVILSLSTCVLPGNNR